MATRTYAAAGLARSVALLRAMCVIAVQRPDTLGVITRPFSEAWIVPLHLGYGGRVAFEQLERAFAHEKRVIDNARNRGSSRKGDEGGGRLVISTLLRKIDQYLVAGARSTGEEDPIEDAAQHGYDFLYRSESIAETHAGICSFGRYTAFPEGGDCGGVVARPGPAHPPARVLFIASMLVSRLAGKVFQHVGLSVAQLGATYDRVAEVLPPIPEEQELRATRANERLAREAHTRLVQVLLHRARQLAGPDILRAILRSAHLRRM